MINKKKEKPTYKLVRIQEGDTLRMAAFHKHKPMGTVVDELIRKHLSAFSLKK